MLMTSRPFNATVRCLSMTIKALCWNLSRSLEECQKLLVISHSQITSCLYNGHRNTQNRQITIQKLVKFAWRILLVPFKQRVWLLLLFYDQTYKSRSFYAADAKIERSAEACLDNSHTGGVSRPRALPIFICFWSYFCCLTNTSLEKKWLRFPSHFCVYGSQSELKLMDTACCTSGCPIGTRALDL